MKKTIIVVMVLSIFPILTSFSHALDNKVEKYVLAKVFIKSNENLKRELTNGKGPKLRIYRYVGDKLTILHEEERGRSNATQIEKLNAPLKSYINRYKVHQLLVYKSSTGSSYKMTSIPYKSSALDLEFPSILKGLREGGAIQIGMAFMTNLALHEFGHVVVADHVGATGTNLNFFKKQNGKFFLGHSSVKHIDDKSKLPFSMGGEVATDLTFEHALQSYRKNPTIYNKSLLFFSGTDFLWYCLYAFYLSDGHPHFDPIAISKEADISRDMLFSVALAKTMINAYRVYSGQDRIIPYFTVDKYSAFLNISIPF